MGWWSTAIMGGDTALDWECLFYDLCDRDTEENIDHDIIDNKLHEMIDLCNNIEFDEDKSIAYQVLGVVLMKNGYYLDNDLKQEIIYWTSKDEWMLENSERKEEIQNYIETVKNYQGKSINIKDRDPGLFNMIAAGINNVKLKPGDPPRIAKD